MKQYRKDVALFFKSLQEIQQVRAGLILMQVLTSFFTALLPFVPIYLSAQIIDGLLAGDSLERLMVLVFLTVFLSLLVTILASHFRHRANQYQSEFNANYEMRLNQTFASLDYASVEDPKTHQLREQINATRNMNGGGMFKIVEVFSNLVQHLFSVVFSVILIIPLFAGKSVAGDSLARFVSSGWFSLLLLLSIGLHIAISMYAATTETKQKYRIMGGIIPFNRVFGYYIEHCISNYHYGKDIRIYRQQDLIKNESMALFSDAHRVIDQLSRAQIKFGVLSTVSTVLLSCIIYLFVGLNAFAGLIGVGAVVQYIGSMSQFTTGFCGFMTQFSMLRSNSEAMQLYFDFMELPAQIQRQPQQGTHAVPTPCEGSYEIVFHEVSFRYPDSENNVLTNLNLTIKAGETLAIVGMNGSGKTTMIKLLCRLYDPTEGRITLNGVDIREFQSQSYWDLFSVCFQDFKLFAFDLGQNIAANREVKDDLALDVLKQVGFHTRLADMPHGLNTALYKDFEDNGVEISGGEAQKIALARALYKNAPFLVLDEPTAALDPIAEFEIYSTLGEMATNKTAIFISHRLSSCKFCNTIAVFHQGAMVQLGTHESLLMDGDGQYLQLWNAQATHYQ